MGNYVRGVRELPKMRQQLQEITAKRVKAERQLKLLKDDLAKNTAFVEKKREEAILGSTQAVEQLQKTIEQDMKQARGDDDHQLEQLLKDAAADGEQRAIRSTKSRRKV